MHAKHVEERKARCMHACVPGRRRKRVARMQAARACPAHRVAQTDDTLDNRRPLRFPPPIPPPTLPFSDTAPSVVLMDQSKERPRTGPSDGPFLEDLSPQEEAMWIAALDKAEAAYKAKVIARQAVATNMVLGTQAMDKPEEEDPAPTVEPPEAEDPALTRPAAGTQASNKRWGRGRGTRSGKGKGPA